MDSEGAVERDRLARRLRKKLGSVPELDRWPSISIVVLNRNGAEYLGFLLDALAHRTAYPHMELVVVDNGSSDGSQDLVRRAQLPFEAKLVENRDNVSFSDATEQGLDRADGELVLCLNNDAEPFEPGWLSELVACRHMHGDAVVAATLLSAPDLTAIQHRGIRFRRSHGRVTAYNTNDPPVGDDVACPAVTAACMLADRQTLHLAGGFCSAYWYGSEDVDLGLALTARGVPAVCSGRSVVLHRESTTRRLAPRDRRARTERENRRYVDARWGAPLERAYRLDRLTGGGFFTDGAPLHLGLIVGADSAAGAPRLGDALAAAGFRVCMLEAAHSKWPTAPRDLDCLVLVDPADGPAAPEPVPLIVLIDGWDERWSDGGLLRRSELVLARGDTSLEHIANAGRHALRVPLSDDDGAVARVLRDALCERERRTSFVLRGARDERHVVLAGRLRSELEARGHRCAVDCAGLDDWRMDVAVYLVRDVAEPVPGQLNVRVLLDDDEPRDSERYDVVLDWRSAVPCASEGAGTLTHLSRERLQIPLVGPPRDDVASQPAAQLEWVERRRLQGTLRLQAAELRELEAEREQEALTSVRLREELAGLREEIAQLGRCCVEQRRLTEQALVEGRELRRVLAAVEGDVRRAAATRGWRLGHAISRLAARMLLRRPQREGSLERALERLHAVERPDDG